MLKRRFLSCFFLCLLVLASLALSACITDTEIQQDQALIDMQVYQPETVYLGTLQPAGSALTQAWETAITLINEAYDSDWAFIESQGIAAYGNAQVELVHGETFSNPADAASAAEELVNLGVTAVVGAYEDNFTAAAANRMAESGVPLFCGSATSGLLTDGTTYDFGDSFFRIAPTPSMEMDMLFNQIKTLNQTQDAQIAKIAVVYEDTSYGKEMLAAVDAAAKTHNLEVVARIAYTQGLSSVAAEVQKTIANEPDVIIQASDGADLQLFLQAYAATRYEPNLLYCCGESFESPGVSSLTQMLELDYVCGMLITPLLERNTPATSEENSVTVTQNSNGESGLEVTIQEGNSQTEIIYNEIFAKLNAAFRARAGRDMNNQELLEMAAIFTICQAIAINGTTDFDALIETLHHTEIEAPYLESGVITFDENGQNTTNPGYMAKLVNGQYQKM